VIRYDAAGHGLTGGPADPAAYEWPQLAADLLGLLDHLGVERGAMGGASMGCATVLHAAVRAPERVDRMVLVIPPTAWETRPAQAEVYELSAAYVEAEGKERWEAAASAMPGPAIFGDDRPPFGADIPQAILPSVLRGAGRSDLPPVEALRVLDIPALVLAWDTDPGHPVVTAERLAEALPSAELHVARTLAEVHAWPALMGSFLA